jgi:hypothetical protein
MHDDVDGAGVYFCRNGGDGSVRVRTVAPVVNHRACRKGTRRQDHTSLAPAYISEIWMIRSGRSGVPMFVGSVVKLIAFDQPDCASPTRYQSVEKGYTMSDKERPT